jgi:polyhydroxybutyrate depolymerase
MKKLILFVLLVLAGCTQAVIEPPPPAERPTLPPPTEPVERARFLTRIMNHNDERRDYFVYVPVNHDPDRGMIMVLHGFGGEARDLRILGFESLADRLGMLIVYPQGLFNGTIGSTYWNANFASGDDDLGFLLALQERLIDEYDINPLRITMTGISNGGYMVNAFMCEYPERLGLAINWIGSMNIATYSACQDPITVPYLHVHGTDDATIPFDTPTLIPEFETPGTVPFIVEHIASINGHTDQITSRYSVSTDRIDFRGGRAPVTLLVVEGFGHLPPIPTLVDFNVYELIEILLP